MFNRIAAITGSLTLGLSTIAQGALVNGTVTSLNPGIDFFPASNINDNDLTAGSAGEWTTVASGSDYFLLGSIPKYTIDLGANKDLNGLAFWNYSVQGNRTTAMSLRFATETEGTSGFGTSIALNPTINPTAVLGAIATNNTIRQDFLFGQTVNARFVELTVLDNAAQLGGGGDRVGFAELKFNALETFKGRLTTADTVTQTAGVAFFPATQASDGNTTTTWVTDARNGGAGDYFNPNSLGNPVLLFDMGEDVTLDGFAFFNYNVAGNAANRFSLRFATDAEGTGGLGTSIFYNPTFDPLIRNTLRQDFAFSEIVRARYIQMTLLDNGYGNGAGGDRVGFSEIQFAVIVPEPATISMGLLGVLALVRRRRIA